MIGFFKYFWQDIGQIFKKLIGVFVALFDFLWSLVNFPGRMEIIEQHNENFNTLDWILLLAANLMIVLVIVVLCILFAKLIRWIFRRYIPAKKYDELAKQVRNLQKDLIRANYEKDKLLSMRVAELGGSLPEQQPEEEQTETPEEAFVPTENRNTFASPCVDPQ